MNNWDQLSEKFIFKGCDTDPLAMENILFLWPSILSAIDPVENKKVLDFGCGTGSFCGALQSEGANVFGVDTSPNMLKIANERPLNIKYAVDINELAEGHFDIITSVHVLEFVSELSKTLEVLSNSLAKSGVLCVAVHDDNYLRQHANYKDNDVYLNLHGKDVKVFPRSELEYDEVMKEHGLSCIYRDRPEYSEDFKKEHKIDKEIKNWAMVLAYQKD